MKLQQELKLKQPLASVNHEALLSLVRTAALMQKLSDRFFSRFGLTDVQFNILMILKERGNDGLSQQERHNRTPAFHSNEVGETSFQTDAREGQGEPRGSQASQRPSGFSDHSWRNNEREN